ncbi:multidrug effflux MFS transporter [Virgisporangium aurantiacum]|uniref:Bcr/CflA family drug resistance efflux transporter n=1 Tax=Virgisporangium aurantiacum TaxID=175570 RepID=A0A8J3ZJ70_9ACTN|nr:multidrug effflux MFS transporter [Virgisporangium aurantiacum]GIJ62970.1 Bcr/CflA family drug resistance efflux transporter [Virgisporangium aurantiacum]
MAARLTPLDPTVTRTDGPAAAPHDQAASRRLGIVLGLLTIFGPISMDLYLPVLPALTAELGSATSTAQLTITACLLGLALGQLIAGPLSDRFGRRRPLLAGVAAYIVTSVLCAISPTIETLIAARFVQGLAGAVGIVIAQAAGRDLYTGRKLVRYYGRLTVLAGLAAIIGPVIGGQLAAVTDWRGLFLFLAALGVAILAASTLVVRETLPPERRVAGEWTRMARDFRRLLTDRVFLGAVLVSGFTNAAIFAYLAGATYVLQGIYQLSPQQYSLAFGLNSLGFMVFGYLGGRLAERWSETGTLATGLGMSTLGAAGLLATAILHLPLIAVVISLLTMVSGVAVTSPPATSLALADYPDIAGTASSLLGLARFAFGGLAAPLVGLGGADNALPLGLVTVTSTALAVTAYATTIRSRHHDRNTSRKPS